jgi:hypothetical protein
MESSVIRGRRALDERIPILLGKISIPKKPKHQTLQPDLIGRNIPLGIIALSDDAALTPTR